MSALRKLCEKWLWPKRECSPAVPQRPNPALRMVDPLLISATASSASLKSFDAPRSILGGRVVLCVFCGWIEVMKPRIDPGTTGAWLCTCRGHVAAHRSCGALRCKCRGPTIASTAFNLRVLEMAAVRIVDISRVRTQVWKGDAEASLWYGLLAQNQKKMMLQWELCVDVASEEAERTRDPKEKWVDMREHCISIKCIK